LGKNEKKGGLTRDRKQLHGGTKLARITATKKKVRRGREVKEKIVEEMGKRSMGVSRTTETTALATLPLRKQSLFLDEKRKKPAGEGGGAPFFQSKKRLSKEIRIVVSTSVRPWKVVGGATGKLKGIPKRKGVGEGVH